MMTTVRPGEAPPAGRGDTERPVRPNRLAAWRRSDRITVFGPPVALVLLIVAFSILSPQFRTMGNFRSILDTGAVLAVVAVGLTFVLMLGAIDLSVEGIMAASALSFALLIANNRNENDLGLVAVVLAIGVGALFGGANGILSTRLRIPSFMTTLGVSAIGIGVATVLFGGVQPTIRSADVTAWATGDVLGLTPLTFVALGVILLGVGLERYTRFGRYARVIGGAEDLALLSGIPVRRYKTLVFVFAGAIYGLAGVMVTIKLGSGIVAVGSGLNFAAITAAVIGGTLLSGGRGGVLHSIVGVLIVSVLVNGLVLIGVDSNFQTAVQGFVVVAAVAITNWPLRRRLRVVK